MAKKTVISSEFNGTKNYVSDYMKKPGGNVYVVTGTTKDIHEAHDFGDQAVAKPIMIRIHNPFDREYKTETISVKDQVSAVVTTGKEKLS